MWEGKDIGDYSNSKVNIQKTPTHNIVVVAQWYSYSHYAERINVAVNLMRARKTKTTGAQSLSHVEAFRKHKNQVWVYEK